MMDGGQNESLVFHSDDISSTQSHRNKDNYFVRVTKNPLLRFLLREKKVEPPKTEVKKPQSVVVKAPEKPKPQFRATIRVSTLRLENLKKSDGKTVGFLTVLVLVMLVLVVGLGYELYNVITVEQPTTEGEMMSARKEMLALVEEPVTTGQIETVLAEMDEQISLAQAGELRQSLKVYKVFLLMDAGYYAEALDYFEEIENGNFTEAQKCELYGYRVELTEKIPGLDVEEYREKYENFCGIEPETEVENEAV